MTVSDIPVEQRGRKTAGTLHFTEFSRTMIAVAQMAADGCIVPISSLLSLSFVIFVQRHDNINFYLYAPPTIAATVGLVFSLARSGVYDVFNTFGCLGVLRSTFRRVLEVMLLLTGCFFIFKVSDDFSRLWLATWSVTSAIALSGSRLISAIFVKTLMRSGSLTKNIAIVGAGDPGQRLAAKLVHEGPGTRLIGLFDQRNASRVPKGWQLRCAFAPTLDTRRTIIARRC